MYKEEIFIVLCKVALAIIACMLMFRLILIWGISILIKIDILPSQNSESGVKNVIVAFKIFDILFSLRKVSCRQIIMGFISVSNRSKSLTLALTTRVPLYHILINVKI